jgi:hypothetical protein
VYKLFDKHYGKKDKLHVDMDWYVSFAIFITCYFAVILLGIAIASMNIPPSLSLALGGYILYLILPFLIIKLMLNYSTKKAIIYSSVVPLVAILAEIPFVLIRGATG